MQSSRSARPKPSSSSNEVFWTARPRHRLSRSISAKATPPHCLPAFRDIERTVTARTVNFYAPSWIGAAQTPPVIAQGRHKAAAAAGRTTALARTRKAPTEKPAQNDQCRGAPATRTTRRTPSWSASSARASRRRWRASTPRATEVDRATASDPAPTRSTPRSRPRSCRRTRARGRGAATGAPSTSGPRTWRTRRST